MSQLRNVYLIFYNLFQALGWAVSLFRVLSNFVSTTSVHGAYSSAGELICLLQTLAFLEVIHGAIGIVPSGALLPLMQWGGRTHFLLAIVRRIHEVQELPSVFITFVAWSLSEVFTLCGELHGKFSKWMTFIRYNAFIVLYPIGVFPGEMWLMHQALPFIKAENLYADTLPFSYDKFIKALLFCYPLLWMKLYLHMFKQRQSKLGKQQKKKSN
ncbi:Very-long-chain (3R)-3-hydroxyacyl-CoA dehydratase 2 [Sesamum angolense]|uniref:Very-long-chain (3R)-3-hydroxyacyl-CoA dehydratase n=1 Tax=Sesamum angolense TaxID=2727404 RepID=A0AAE1XBH8_9LAMI|nr:Very-long-chain (3R)-3-hydroxyacyl-CoA dehydratase 2 [Sesamum angolense]